MDRVGDVSIELYSYAAEHARRRGVILADTKFEFGFDATGGRSWSATRCSRPTPPGTGQPMVSESVVHSRASTSSSSGIGRPAAAGTSSTGALDSRGDRPGHAARYIEAYELITGEPLRAWLERTGAPASEPLTR